MGTDLCHGCRMASYPFPSPPPPTEPTGVSPSAVPRVVTFPLSPLPIHTWDTLPSVPLMLMAAGGHSGQFPGVCCRPSTKAAMGSMHGGSPEGQSKQAGEDRVSLLLSWLLGTFLSRNHSVLRHQVLVFSSISTIKISCPGQCKMNFGKVLKPWL